MPDNRTCDLHVHSTYSEGVLTPAELVERAKSNDIGAMVLTDHNDISGISEFQGSAAEAQIETLTGIELYVRFQGKNLHLLGYGFTTGNMSLNNLLGLLQEDRRAKIQTSLAALQAAGFKVDPLFITTIPSKYPGLAQIISHLEDDEENNRKIAADFALRKPDLFSIINMYFAEGKPAYLPESSVTLEEGVRQIGQAGGIAVLAHPGQQLMAEEDHIIYDALAAGVRGIEVVSPYHTWHQVEHYQNLALDAGVIMTGGSDFHTDINFTSREKIANQWQIHKVPYQLFTGLKQALNLGNP